jgi:hypothetical protein
MKSVAEWNAKECPRLKQLVRAQRAAFRAIAIAEYTALWPKWHGLCCRLPARETPNVVA